MSDNRGTNRDAEACVVSMAPDVCLTPMGPTMVPVPYTITCKFDVAQATATRTRFGGQPVFTMGSHLPTVQGDEPGTGGGLPIDDGKGVVLDPAAGSGRLFGNGVVHVPSAFAMEQGL